MECLARLFCFTLADLPPREEVTKRALTSDFAITYDVLGWFSHTIIKVKTLQQCLWEENIAWDDPVPAAILRVWSQWRDELQLLPNRHIPRCHFPKDAKIISMQLHGFSDASQLAYAASAVYLRIVEHM